MHALTCSLLFCAWLFFYNDFPERNRFVSAVELEKIHRDKTKAHIEMDSFVPYKVLLLRFVTL